MAASDAEEACPNPFFGECPTVIGIEGRPESIMHFDLKISSPCRRPSISPVKWSPFFITTTSSLRLASVGAAPPTARSAAASTARHRPANEAAVKSKSWLFASRIYSRGGTSAMRWCAHAISHELGHLLLHDQEQLYIDHDFCVRPPNRKL